MLKKPKGTHISIFPNWTEKSCSFSMGFTSPVIRQHLRTNSVQPQWPTKPSCPQDYPARASSEQTRKVSLHTFLASSTKMLLLPPSMAVLCLLALGSRGSVTWGVTRISPAGARVVLVPLDPLLCCPFVQDVRMVACRRAVVVFLGQQLR